MSFLNPVLLAFTGAIAIPILIHLLNRRRFRRVPWAAMRFLRASVERNRRRMQWEDLLLLLLRCLVVVLLALALARPAVRATAAFLETGRATAVVVLDPSSSLAAQDGAQSRFDLARAAAEAAIDSYPAGSALALLLAGDRVEEAASLSEPTFDLNLVRQTLREARVSDLATDHAVGVTRALEILRDQASLRKEVVLVTDRQAAGWRRVAEIASALADVARDTRLRVVLVGAPLDENLAVAGLSRSAGFATTTEPVRFQADIANLGATPFRQVQATLHLNAGPAADEAVIDSLAPGETRRLTFFAKLGAAGPQAVRVRLASDRLPSDDERSIVVRAVDGVRVLMVDGDPESNSAFFLGHALQPVPPDLAADYFLQPRTITPGQLALTRLDEYDAVILADVPNLSGPAVEALAKYVREGGALLVFPGPATQPAFYNEELARRAGLLPATLDGIRGDPASESASFALQPPRYDHPLFALWNEPGAGLLTGARFRAAWRLTPHPPSAATNPPPQGGVGLPVSRVMITFADGSPAAIEGVVGRGRTLLFSSTAGTGWNDLAVRPAFVPMLHRAVASLAEAQEAQFNIPAGARLDLRMPSELAGREVVVTTPGTPERRVTRTVRGGPEGPALDFDETSLAGVYRVGLPGETRPIAVFAAQLDPGESDLTELTDSQLAEIRGFAQVLDWEPGQDLRAAFDRERVGIELWLPLALSVLLLGLSETWLAQAFSRSK